MKGCPSCLAGGKHPKLPFFVYLLSDKRCVNNPKQHKTVPYIGLTTNPFIRLSAHNREGKQFGKGSQLTKIGAGNYQLELVFGPISRGGRKFKKTCRSESRMIRSRILRFCDYALYMQKEKKVNAFLYARDTELIRNLYKERAESQRV